MSPSKKNSVVLAAVVVIAMLAMVAIASTARGPPVASLATIIGGAVGAAVIGWAAALAYCGRRAENLRQHYDRALLDSESLLEGLLDGADTAIYIKAVDGRYRVVNDHFAALTGARRDMLVNPAPPPGSGSSIIDLLHSKDQDVASRGEAIHWEHTAGFADGEHAFSSKTFPLRDATGRIYAIAGVITDVSDLKARDREREALLAAERAARELAERTVRGKDQFLSVLSHELRTPLNALVGWLHILQMPSIAPEIRERAIRGLERSAAQQRRLVDDLLDTARMLTNRLSVTSRPIELAPIFDAVQARHREAANAKGVHLWTSIELPIAETELRVLGDAGRLEQALNQLVDNAIKFTPSGGEVNLGAVSDGSYIQLRVVDTGEGIDPAVIGQLFQSFQQADATITRRHGGLGVGLALVRQLVELQGGTVEASSTGRGAGATFSIRLARAPAERVSTVEANADDAIKPIEHIAIEQNATDDHATSLQGVHILAVDDQYEMRDVLETLLRRWGAQVEVVASAPAARARYDEWARGGGERVFISDIAMPEEDGLQLISKLRETERAGRLPRVPAVALSAHSESGSASEALRAGFDVFIAKPIDPNFVRHALERLVGR